MPKLDYKFIYNTNIYSYFDKLRNVSRIYYTTDGTTFATYQTNGDTFYSGNSNSVNYTYNFGEIIQPIKCYHNEKSKEEENGMETINNIDIIKLLKKKNILTKSKHISLFAYYHSRISTAIGSSIFRNIILNYYYPSDKCRLDEYDIDNNSCYQSIIIDLLEYIKDEFEAINIIKSAISTINIDFFNNSPLIIVVPSKEEIAEFAKTNKLRKEGDIYIPPEDKKGVIIGKTIRGFDLEEVAELIMSVGFDEITRLKLKGSDKIIIKAGTSKW